MLWFKNENLTSISVLLYYSVFFRNLFPLDIDVYISDIRRASTNFNIPIIDIVQSKKRKRVPGTNVRSKKKTGVCENCAKKTIIFPCKYCDLMFCLECTFPANEERQCKGCMETE